MTGAQGRMPRVVLPGRMAGQDCNGSTTFNSVEYRGKPYSRENAIDQNDLDYWRENASNSVRLGLRVLGIYLNTSRSHM